MQITARAIVVKALRELKVIAANESGDAADLDIGLQALNDMLDAWSISPNNILSTDIETFPATGAQEYTIGQAGMWVTDPPVSIPTLVYSLDGVDYTLGQINEDQFAQIAVKNTPGMPAVFWFTRGTDIAYLDVWPIPSTGTLTMHSFKPMTEFVDLDTIYTAAPGYKNALSYSLAVELAPAFEAEASKTTLVKAMNAKRALKRSNVVVPIMDISFVPTEYQSNGTDWRFQ